MKVRATKDGFYGGEFRAAGAEFNFAGPKPGSWMEVIEVAKPAPAMPAKGSAKPVAKTVEAKSPEGNDDLI